MNTIRIHFFDTTGDAYDCTQCMDEIKNGDILVVASEQAVGLADTWPVAVTISAGAFHTLNDGVFTTYHHQYGENAGQPVFTQQQVDLARAVAKGMGFELR